MLRRKSKLSANKWKITGCCQSLLNSVTCSLYTQNGWKKLILQRIRRGQNNGGFEVHKWSQHEIPEPFWWRTFNEIDSQVVVPQLVWKVLKFKKNYLLNRQNICLIFAPEQILSLWPWTYDRKRNTTLFLSANSIYLSLYFF